MKKITLKFALLLFVALFTSCKEYIYIEKPEEPVDESSYTIMLYGCGGGNLDLPMVTNIREALLSGSTDRVKFTGQIKFSAKYQEYEETAGTQRFIVGSTPENWYTPVEVLPANLPLYDPKNLTDFINWSKEQCPSDEYILLLWNHGGAWTPMHDGPSQNAVIYDDILNDKALSLDGLVKGIKDSGTKMKMIYYDACLMGMAEILAGLTECADYVLSASHITPGIGGDYNSLLHNLNNSTDFEQAIRNYAQETMSHWNPQGYPLDLMLVNLNKMDILLGELNVFSGYLEEMVKIASKALTDPNNMTVDEACIYESLIQALNNCYMYEEGYPFFDLTTFVEMLVNGGIHSYSAKVIDISSRLNRAFGEVIVFKELSSIITGKLDLSMGVTILNNQLWKQYNYDDTYPTLKFHKATNWGNWVSINPFLPTGNPYPGLITGGDEDEGGEDDGEDDGVDYELLLILEIINSR